jgi:NO-binding membrane sensor protein with MHYT domain
MMDSKTENGLSTKPYCGAGIELAQRISGLEASDLRQWEVLDKLQNRLPAWATLVISLLTFITGCALTYAAMKGGA